jgi:hypothetical protein
MISQTTNKNKMRLSANTTIHALYKFILDKDTTRKIYHHTMEKHMVSKKRDVTVFNYPINNTVAINNNSDINKQISCDFKNGIKNTSQVTKLTCSVNLKNTITHDISSTFEHYTKDESNVFNKKKANTFSTMLQTNNMFEPVLDL